ncbi:MAG: 50S ribosome-binding GTPase [Crocinitomicaceae bacterium]|nr:50S ribosome-binding GTPase [Crocinitomicaceae bacterium]
MEIIRISTAGSVDDGKSTLIGRLLYDTQSLSKDKIENIKSLSQQKGLKDIDLSLITDGLTAEREQGITIDVAHIYFNTPNRKYIIADTPGHIEYTRNMITGASNASVFMILIDARQGIVEQTKRHLFIASLLEIEHIVFVINKMDLVSFEESVYLNILAELKKLEVKFELEDRKLTYIPISAKLGDNVVNRSNHMDWYTGPSLLTFLEQTNIEEKPSEFRFNVQYVIRPQSDQFHDFRGYAGKVKSGKIQLGDEIKVLSSGQSSKIKAIHRYKEQLLSAKTNDSVTIELEDDIDISRGDILTLSSSESTGDRLINSKICWLDKEPLVPQKRYLLKYNAATVPVKIDAIESQLNFTSLDFETNPDQVGINSINQISIKTAAPIYLDQYRENPKNGYFILVDEVSNNTVGVGFKN